MTLEQAAYWSQIAVAVISVFAVIGAVFAAKVAFDQLQTFKQFELMKILEDAKTRKARRCLFQVDDSDKEWRTVERR